MSYKSNHSHKKKNKKFSLKSLNRKAAISSAVIAFIAIAVITGSCGKAQDFVKGGLSQSSGTAQTQQSSQTSSQQSSSSNDTSKTAVSGSNLKVSFIDVGLGDSILIEKDGHSMLIDAATRDSTGNVLKYLKSENIKSLDYVFGTHPHEDHIGGLDDVIRGWDVESFFMPNFPRTTACYRDVINAASKKKLTIKRPEAGKSYKLSDAQFTILAPNSKEYKETNDYSIVIKLVYGKTSFLFTGDAQNVSEYEMIKKGYDLKADVLKVGHHGSKTSSTQKFLSAVKPKYAVISSANQEKNLPAASTVSRLESNGAKVYETYKSGNVIAISDGNNITFKTQKAA